MSDMDAIFMALGELARQNREQAAEIAELKAASQDHHDRLTAHAMLIMPARTGHAGVQHYAGMALQVRAERDAA